MLLPNHLHQLPLWPAPVELAVEDLLPQAEVELAEVEMPDVPVDPAKWVNIRLRMPKPTGDLLEITLLRPVEWLAEHLAQATALDEEHPQALAETRETGSAARFQGITSVMPVENVGEPAPGVIEPVTANRAPRLPSILLTLHDLEAMV